MTEAFPFVQWIGMKCHNAAKRNLELTGYWREKDGQEGEADVTARHDGC